MTTYNPTAAAAMQRRMDEHSEVKRIMASEEYRAGDLAAHTRVRLHFVQAHGLGNPTRTAMGPGQVPANPFGSRE